MKIRFFQTYDKNGVESNKILQYWDEEIGGWINVGLVRCREDEADLYNGEEHLHCYI